MYFSDPEKIAKKFINEFHSQKVSGSEMLQFLTKAIERYGTIMEKKGFKEGRAQKEKVYAEGLKAGEKKTLERLKKSSTNLDRALKGSLRITVRKVNKALHSMRKSLED